MPKRCLRATKRRPRAPKTRQRDAQKVSRTLQNRAQRAPGRISCTILVGSCVRKALGPIVCPFFSSCAMRVHVKNLEKPKKNCGFCTCRAFSYDVPACTKNLAKYVLGASKTLPGPSQNPPKSSLERPKVLQKWPRRAKSAQEGHKKRPRARKWRPRAKNVPTWPQLGEICTWILATQAVF